MKLKHVFKILIIALIIALSMLFSSCDIMKKSQKSKTDTSIKTEEETKIFRKGDSVSYRPVINNPIYKDTTIYRVTKNNTRLETVYDSNGNIRDINCYTDKIEELTKRNFELENSEKNKQKEKTENFDSSFILYIVVGVVVLGIFAIIMMFIFINKNTKSVTAILNNLPK
ncbi:hypothetical protein [Flavobacterium sp.]|uniref:hypothetical protein n=1 Tax=Flavobacterium sp. TaxID=239 RepID=UPI00261CBB6C|nr:hypothetical protein [Flavobacterium sp.]